MTNNRDFSRQSFLGPNAEVILANLRVAIVGLGGGGSHIAQQLAHIGVGHYRLVDPQKIESSNLNRLVGATQDDVDQARSKVDIIRRTILGIRPWAKVIIAEKNWQEVPELIKDAHVLFSCVDTYRQRDYLEIAARRYCLPYIDIGMGVTEVSKDLYAVAGQSIMTRPGQPCLRCLGFLTTERLSREEDGYGDVGINPQVVWTNGTLASLAVGALMQLVTPWFNKKAAYVWLELDGNNQQVTPSRQPDHTPRIAICPHHGGDEGVGDPMFAISKVS